MLLWLQTDAHLIFLPIPHPRHKANPCALHPSFLWDTAAIATASPSTARDRAGVPSPVAEATSEGRSRPVGHLQSSTSRILNRFQVFLCYSPSPALTWPHPSPAVSLTTSLGNFGRHCGLPESFTRRAEGNDKSASKHIHTKKCIFITHQ